jgi:multimeric flavodoxin WrbA
VNAVDIIRSLVKKREIATPDGVCTLILEKEDFSLVYPGMFRFTVRKETQKDSTILFKTNTYEYAPLVPLQAERAALQAYDEWVTRLEEETETSADQGPVVQVTRSSVIFPDAVLIQGSPRAPGNCGILAGWVADTLRSQGKTVRVVFCDELDIHPCIGCYQCYNTGVCTFDDEMKDIIAGLRFCTLVAVFSPVYTFTVPGNLKILTDRSLAYHAERVLTGPGPGIQKGLLFSVAGRKGMENFLCTTKVINAFFRNLGISPSGSVLVDEMDMHNDIRIVEGIQEKVRELVQKSI